MGALYIDNSGDVTVAKCNFYGNWAQGQYGGAPAHMYRSTVKFVNCVFRDNSANYRGAAIRLRSNDAGKGYTTFENCVFKFNTNYHNLGGAVFMSHGAEMTFVNCVLTGNKAVTSGAAIYANSSADYPCKLNIINTTIAGNTITGDVKDGQVTSTQYANINTVNSVIVSDNENTADIFFTAGEATDKFSFVSGGYNYVGTVVDKVAVAASAIAKAEGDGDGENATTRFGWLESDNVADANDYASIFGTNSINDKNEINPVKHVAGASAANLTTAVGGWNLPAGVGYTKDIRGIDRAESTMPGAAAYTQAEVAAMNPTTPTGIEDLAADKDSRLTIYGNGIYGLSGADSIEVYTMNGVQVAAVSGDTVDLSGQAKGVYLIRAGKSVFKVMK